MTNSISGNFYIGSSINVSQRIKTHKQQLRLGYKGNYRISDDLNKYGIDSFHFESLEYCEASIMKDREQYYFDLLSPTYNVWNNVYSAAGRSYTPEQLQRFRDLRKKHPIKDVSAFSSKLKEAWKLRRLRPDGQATIAMLNRTGKFHSEDTKKKYSESRKGRPKSQSMRDKLRLFRLGTKWDPIKKAWIKKEGESHGSI